MIAMHCVHLPVSLASSFVQRLCALTLQNVDASWLLVDGSMNTAAAAAFRVLVMWSTAGTASAAAVAPMWSDVVAGSLDRVVALKQALLPPRPVVVVRFHAAAVAPARVVLLGT